MPATSANLGPGFDCLGLALDIPLRVSVRVVGTKLSIRTGGAEPGDIALDERNNVFRALQRVYDAAGTAVPGLAIKIDNDIPLARGLGSSAAAFVAGLAAGNALLGSPFDRQELLALGLPLEGHPDNLAPALFGGLVVSSIVADAPVVLSVPLPRLPVVVLYVPDAAMSTEKARSVLPDAVPRSDAVFNTGRAVLLTAALATGDFRPLRWAMEDRLHQPYRATIFPQLPALIAAALDAGAVGAALSGAGSSIIALCEGDGSATATAMEDAAARHSLPGKAVFTRVDTAGTRVLS